MRFLRRTFLPFLAALLLLPWDSNAGFWVKKQDAPAIEAVASIEEAAEPAEAAQLITNYSSATQHIAMMKEHKLSFLNKLQQKFMAVKNLLVPKRWFAILLSLLNITVLFYLGWPRFYLGYKRTGLLQLVLSVLGLIGIGLIYTAYDSTSYEMFILGAFLVGLGLFSWIWQIVDAFRIILNTLKPRVGYWRAKR